MENHHCHEHDHHSQTDSLVKYTEINDFNLLLNLLAIALVGSFTHCAAMCGPIAGLLSASKMLKLTGKKLNNWSRVKASLNIEYILGKAFTYSIMAGFAFFLKEQLKDIYAFKILAFLILILTALSFLSAALYNFNIPFFKKSKFVKSISKIVENLVKQPILKKFPRPFAEIMRGMALGLIPCGFVYSSIILAVSFGSNFFVASASMFAFGLATSPALIIASFLGSSIVIKTSKVFRLILFILCILNAALLVSYALKLI